MSKSKRQLKHFKRRARERFGMLLTQNDVTNIVRMIGLNQARMVEKQSNRTSVYSVWYQERHFRVVYDKIRKTLVTVLYHDEKELMR